MNYLKKSKLLIVMFIVVLSIHLTGCGRRDKDFEFVSESERLYDDADEKRIGKTLDVPAGVQINMSTKDTDFDTIEVIDDDIYVPECENMKIYTFKEYDLSGEKTHNIVNTLFDEQAGIYVKDHDAETKEEIRNTISIYEENISNLSESNEDDMHQISYFENEIEKLNERLADAPDSLPQVKEEDFENPYHTYVGKCGDINYELELSDYFNDEDIETEYQKGDIVLLDFYRTKYENEKLARKEGADSIFFGPEKDFSVDTKNMVNEALLSKEKAETEAFDFMEKLGIDDFVIDWTDSMIVLYYDGEIYKPKLNGYVVRLKRTLDNCDVFALNMPPDLYDDMYDIENFSEYAEIDIDDTGVVSATVVLYTDTATIKSTDANLLSWNDMLSCANEEIGQYYKKYKSNYKSVAFNDVSLQYIMSIDDNGSKCYIPAWLFIQYDDRLETENPSNCNIENIICIHAVDGKYIDIYENVKKLGMCK